MSGAEVVTGFAEGAIDLAPIATTMVTDGTITAANDAAAALFGTSPADLVGRELSDLLVEPEHVEAVLDARPRGPHRMATTLAVGDRRLPADLHLAAHPAGGVMVQIVAEPSSAADELRAERAFRSAMIELQVLVHDTVDDREFYSTLLQRAAEVVPGAQLGSILVRQPGVWRYEFEASVGCDLERIRRYPVHGEELFRDDADTRARVVSEHQVPEDLEPDRLRWMLEDCRVREIKASVVAPVHLDGEPVAIISLDNVDDPDAFGATAVEMTTALGQLITDLIRRRRLEAELRAERAAYLHQAMHDDLTGLANRRRFQQRLDEVLALSDPRGTAVFFVDVDDFKQINDQHGHDGGDEVLLELGRRLATTVRSSDLVARWGGDEFVILAFEMDESQVQALAERLVRRSREPISLTDGTIVQTSVTVGIAWSASPDTGDDLLQIADGALFRAKADGKGRHDLVAV